MPFGCFVWPVGVRTTREKKSVASFAVDETFTLIFDDPTIEIGLVSGSLSRKPDCPGRNAALVPVWASAVTADPIPGSDEIAPGMPPIGATSAVNGVVIGIWRVPL